MLSMESWNIVDIRKLYSLHVANFQKGIPNYLTTIL